MALSNLTRVCFFGGERKGDIKSPRDGDNQLLYKVVFFFFFPRRCHDAPRSLYRTMFIFWYTCGVVVLYSTLFLLNFLHFNMYPSLMTSTDPENALFNVFCQKEYWAILTGKMRWLGNERKRAVRFSYLKFPRRWFTNFQRGNFSEQSILHLTSMEHLSLLISFIFLPIFIFFLLHFLRYGVKFEHDPSVSFKRLATK